MNLLKAIWRGPFYVGKLQRPVSVGDVLLKLLEVLWRALISVIAIAILILALSVVWTALLSPILFPPLKDSIAASASYDDGTLELPPPIIAQGTDRFRCTPEHPVKIRFENLSNKIVAQTEFKVNGQLAGRSGEVVKYDRYRSFDTILKPGHYLQGCWSFPLQEGVRPQDVIYSVTVTDAKEGDENLPGLRLGSKRNSDALSLSPLAASAWTDSGGGCACAFTSTSDALLLVSGFERMLFELNGAERQCAAPELQALFDGKRELSCDEVIFRIEPKVELSGEGDGFGSPASLLVKVDAQTKRIDGTWGCAC